jgi:aminoglycoside phosphotransferase (APT) family kinase protein
MRRIELPARVPELLGVSVETATEIEGGWDYVVFEVNGEWIVRIPRRAEVEGWLRKEIRLLPAIAPLLPLPVPRFEVVADGDEALPFVAYRKLPGRPADAALRGTVDAPSLGAALGSFLAALHAFPMPPAMSFTRTDPESQGWLEQQEELRERSEREVYPLLEPDERTRADRVFEEYLSSVDDVSPALVHGDLGPDHVLCSTDTVTGVIDWSDASVGDPAIDLAWPTHATPRDFADALLEAYGPEGTGPSERSPYYYRVAHLHQVLHALDHDDGVLLESGLRSFRERLP